MQPALRLGIVAVAMSCSSSNTGKGAGNIANQASAPSSPATAEQATQDLEADFEFVSLVEADLSTLEGKRIAVHGTFFVSKAGVPHICGALDETAPPTCAASFELVGEPIPGALAELEHQGVRWSSTFLEVRWTVQDGKLDVASYQKL